MSDAIAFDTHRFVKNLTGCGFTEEQAEGLADEQVRLLNSNLATKTDIAAVKAELQAEIQKTKAELLKWMVVVAMIAQAGLIAALIAWLSTVSG